MFDLEFFKIVHQMLSWAESPKSHFVCEHEYRLERRKSNPYAASCIENFGLMSPEKILLQTYVKTQYPPYFGVTLYTGSVLTKFSDSALRRF